ncbi:MAG: hypothetical protein IJQ63_12610, partial [Synergistaceae bacterium]|nr:hypothetical protein [Synergistaceae bacterium]
MPLNEENEIKINNKNKSSAGEPRTAGEKLKRELDEIASPKGIPDLDYASYFEKLKGRVKAKPKAKAKNKAKNKAQAHDFADVLLRLEPEQEPQENLEPAPELEAEVIEEPQEPQEPEEIIEPEIINEQEPESLLEPENFQEQDEPQEASDDDIYIEEEDFAENNADEPEQNLKDDNLRGLSQFADVVLKLEPDEPDIIVEEPLSDVVIEAEDL